MDQAQKSLERQVNQHVNDAAAEDDPKGVPDALEGVGCDLSEQRQEVLLYKIP